ncbi:hypothetical protein GF357_02675 [Candidatus Dojkabacteria bacterium]|nr:hypothetical protein [Candidatus Dojkabacteria bacterium]
MRIRRRRFSHFVITLMILASALSLSACSKADNATEDESNDDGVQVIDLSDTSETEVVPDGPADEEPAQEADDDPEEADTEESETVVGITMKDFVTQNQKTGGKVNSAVFVLSSVEQKSESGFHRFIFDLNYQEPKKVEESETDGEYDSDDGEIPTPPVEVRYRSDRGSIIVDLEGLQNDTSSIGYFSSKTINKDGITRLYHALVDSSTGERYEIGVNKVPEFRLFVDNAEGDSVSVVVDVKYPGGSGRTSVLGASDYSVTRQEIEGASKADGAGLSTFSYRTVGGETVIQFDVKGPAGNPIPKSYAEYDETGVLNLVFPSLKSHHTSNASAQYQIAGVGAVDYSQTGDESRFAFPGVTADSEREFKLSGESAPHHVTFRISQ